MQTSPCLIPLDAIRTEGTQLRARPEPGVIAEYAAALRDGAEFPPIVVYAEGTDYWLGDGHHRLAAAREAGRSEIRAEVRTGGRRDAILHAAGANATHGLRRTNADKKNAVFALLSDPVWRTWSDRELARRCGVTPPLVGRIRRTLCVNDLHLGPRTAVRGGSVYQVSARSRQADDPYPKQEFASSETALDGDIQIEPEAPVPLPIQPGEWWAAGLHRIFCGDPESAEFRHGLTVRRRVPQAAVVSLPCAGKARVGVELDGASPLPDYDWTREICPFLAAVPQRAEIDMAASAWVAFYAHLLTRISQHYREVLVPEIENVELLLAAELSDRVVLGSVSDPERLGQMLAEWQAETGTYVILDRA